MNSLTILADVRGSEACSKLSICPILCVDNMSEKNIFVRRSKTCPSIAHKANKLSIYEKMTSNLSIHQHIVYSTRSSKLSYNYIIIYCTRVQLYTDACRGYPPTTLVDANHSPIYTHSTHHHCYTTTDTFLPCIPHWFTVIKELFWHSINEKALCLFIDCAWLMHNSVAGVT